MLECLALNLRSCLTNNFWSRNVLATFSCTFHNVIPQMLDVFYNSVRSFSEGFRNGELRCSAGKWDMLLGCPNQFLGLNQSEDFQNEWSVVYRRNSDLVVNWEQSEYYVIKYQLKIPKTWKRTTLFLGGGKYVVQSAKLGQIIFSESPQPKLEIWRISSYH